ncbi:MAG: protein kinase [Planctomycetes bacterium]|nr:protein kinase [Planctomycetota bacterium]
MMTQCTRCGEESVTDRFQGMCPRCLLQETDMPDKEDPLLTHGKFGNLEVVSKIGEGGMGAVYKANQPQLNRCVALKILSPALACDPDFRERFIVEAQVLAKLSHPNVVTVYDFGEKDGLYYLVMEFVEGTNLRQVLDSNLHSRDELLKLVAPLCEALEYAHGQGVIHRDIKPENILVDRHGRVKITDFGLAKIANPSKKITRVGVVMGTPHYMAPEQTESLEAADHRADVYSLGAVVYEILTGTLPARRYVRPSRVARTDPRMDRILERALRHDPAARYQTASELAQAITVVINTPPSPPRKALHLALGAVAMVAMVVVGILLFQDRGGGAPVTPGMAQDEERKDGAHYREGAIHLSWGETFGHLKGKQMRIYRRTPGESEVLLAETRDTSYTDEKVDHNRPYTYRIVLVATDGKDAALALTLEASTIATRYVVGEFEIHYGQGFRFATGEVIDVKNLITGEDITNPQDVDLFLSGIWGNISQWMFETPYGGTNGDEDPSRHGPPVGIGKFEAIVEFPKRLLRPSITMDKRSPDSLEVCVIRTKTGGIAKCKVVPPIPDRRTNWTRASFWIRYVYSPAGDRFVPTREEVDSTAITLDDIARKRAEDWVVELGADEIERRERATARLVSLGTGALPFIRERLAQEKDRERDARLEKVLAALAKRCQPLQIALTAPDQGLRESAEGKLRALFGEARPIESEAERVKAERDARLVREHAERQKRVRKARIDAVAELHPYPAGAARAELQRKATRWSEAKDQTIANEILAEGAKAAPVISPILAGKAGSEELIDSCLALAKNVVVLDARTIPHADETGTCYFSFHSETHGYRGVVSLLFGNGEGTFQVQMYGGQKNSFTDLGVVDFAAVKAPESAEERADWSEDTLDAIVGHTYLEHIWEDDIQFYVKFKVLAMEPDGYVVLLWEKLTD